MVKEMNTKPERPHSELLTFQGQQLAAIAQANRQKVEALHKETEAIRDKAEKEVYRLRYDVYRPKIRDLEQACEEAVRKAMQESGDKIGEKRQAIEELYQPVKQVERILEFFRLEIPIDLHIDEEKITPHKSYGKNPYKENLGYAYEDSYLKVKLYILENDKPVNKYSLAAIGKCVFDSGLGERPLLKLPRSYGVPFNTPWGSSPEYIIRESPYIESLYAYLKTRQESAKLFDWLPAYKAVKEEYLAILRTYRLTDFTEFITLYCPKCSYFTTVFESYHLNPGEIRTCPRDSTPLDSTALMSISLARFK